MTPESIPGLTIPQDLFAPLAEVEDFDLDAIRLPELDLAELDLPEAA